MGKYSSMPKPKKTAREIVEKVNESKKKGTVKNRKETEIEWKKTKEEDS